MNEELERLNETRDKEIEEIISLVKIFEVAYYESELYNYYQELQ